MTYQSIIRDPGGNWPVRMVSDQRVVNGSILIVPANTVAIVSINGIESDPYYPGRHDIYTGVDPFFVRFRNLMTHGDPGITCQVFYVNTVQELCEQGGTGNIVFQEKRYQLSMSAKAAYTIRYVITNPKQYISKLVGMHNNSFDNEDIQPKMKSMILPAIKGAVADSLANGDIYSIQSNLSGVGSDAYARLSNELQSYGITLKAIAITSIQIPETELKRRKELEDKEAKGYLNTRIERNNINEIYGDVDNRTRVEVLTGGLRGPATPVAGRAGVGGMAGAMTALPWQIAMAKMAMDQMNGLNSMGTANSNTSTTTSQSSSNTEGVRRRVPPPVPVRPKLCLGCGRALDSTDMFCKYCGNRL